MSEDFKTLPAKHAIWRLIFLGIMEEMHFDNGLHQFTEGGTILRYLRSPSFKCLHTLQMPSTNSACDTLASNDIDFSGRGSKRQKLVAKV